MTTLRQLVPPFELCRKIPKDAFNGTALVWKKYHRGIMSDNPYVAERNTWDHEFCEDPEQPIVPAPTAQEILEAMKYNRPDISCVWAAGTGDWHVWHYTCTANAHTACVDCVDILTSGNNLPEALLKLWLDVREVEHAGQEGNR